MTGIIIELLLIAGFISFSVFSIIIYRNIKSLKSSLKRFYSSLKIVNENIVEIYNSLDGSEGNFEYDIDADENTDIICENCAHRVAYISEGQEFGFVYICDKDKKEKKLSDTCMFFKLDPKGK